jgi:hypothetical protein
MENRKRNVADGNLRGTLQLIILTRAIDRLQHGVTVSHALPLFLFGNPPVRFNLGNGQAHHARVVPESFVFGMEKMGEIRVYFSMPVPV